MWRQAEDQEVKMFQRMKVKESKWMKGLNYMCNPMQKVKANWTPPHII